MTLSDRKLLSLYNPFYFLFYAFCPRDEKIIRHGDAFRITCDEKVLTNLDNLKLTVLFLLTLLS